MQLKSGIAGPLYRFLFCALAPAALGCPGNKPVTTIPRPAQPYAGATLKLGGTSEAVVRTFTAGAQGWASRTGAKVELSSPGEADVVIVPPAEVGAYAERDDALPVPPELKALDHPGQWVRILPIYRDRLAAWAGVPRAIPLAGDGHVLVVNRELLRDAVLLEKYQSKFGHPAPGLPATWDDLVELSEAGLGLPFSGFTPHSGLDEFFRMAACADRPALAESDLNKAVRDGPFLSALLSFTHQADTGAPRLDSPGFAAAHAWRDRMKTTGHSKDPSKLLADGQTACAVVSLAELARLPKNPGGLVAGKFQLAPLPGSRTAFDPISGQPVDLAGRVNYVPFLNGGWFGVVRKDCANPAAAFDLLADLAGPQRSLERTSDPALGFGPFRSEHFDAQGDVIWQRYGFDAARTRDLAEALRKNVAVSVVNPAFGVRGPDAAELLKLLDDSLEGPDGLKTAQHRWQAHDAQTPQAKSWRRRAAGLP